MPKYEVADYLLDRANIHDTVTKLWMLVDMREWARLAREVPAPQMVLDYTRMFGGRPSSVTPAELVAKWRPLMEGMDATHHATSSLLVELPQPGPDVERPGKATVYLNVITHLSRKGAADGEVTSNGGRGKLELERQSNVSSAENPWRVTLLQVHPAWVEGNTKILTDA